MIEVVTIETPSLGDRTYLATDGASALVIDAQRDIDRVLAVAATRGVAVTHVFETHIHNDYVSGGLALARRSGAAYHVNAADTVAFGRVGIGDGDTIDVGPSIRVRVIATPGHTFTHLAYALEDAATGEVAAVFTGGSLLYGSAGRPDLLGAEHTHTLAAAQHASARRLARVLPDRTPVCPTHGFGSFCAATTAQAAASTIGDEKRSNPALTLDRDSYVVALVAGLDAYPAYYAHMAAANAAGPDAPGLAPPARVSAGELGRRIGAGEWVVDLRHRRAFAAGHLPGSLSFEYAGQLRHLPRLADPLGHPADPGRGDRPADRRRAARPGPDRDRPPGRGRHHELGRLAICAVPGQLPRQRLPGPGRRPGPAGPGRPGRPPRTRAGSRSHRRLGSRAAARAAGPPA